MVDYANTLNVRKMLKYTGDEADDELFEVSVSNANATVTSRLNKHRLPEPEGSVPIVLETSANYYAVSDILQALHPDARSTNEEAYYNKAESLLESYVVQQLADYDNELIKKKMPYRYSKSPSRIHEGVEGLCKRGNNVYRDKE